MSQFGLSLEIQAHEVEIPSNRKLPSCDEYVPAPCTHRPSNQPSGLRMRFFQREIRILGSQGGLSRNKVAVGGSAAGSPPRNYGSTLGVKSLIFAVGMEGRRRGIGPVDQFGRSSALHAGGLGFKSRRVHLT